MNRFRVLVARKHVIFYRFEEASGEIAIAAIIDGRRDIAALIDDL